MMPHWYTRWVERLREQPAPVKSQVALFGAIIVTSLIALVWVTTLPARFSTLSGAGSSVRAGVAESLENAPLPKEEFVPEQAEKKQDTETQDEKEILRSRIDALVSDFARQRAEREADNAQKDDAQNTVQNSIVPVYTTPTSTIETPVSTPGAPVLIEVR
jgi:hypothetical protein